MNIEWESTYCEMMVCTRLLLFSVLEINVNDVCSCQASTLAT